MIGLQGLGYPSTILHESRTKLVKFTSVSWPNFRNSLDNIRTPPHPLRRIPTHTPTVTFSVRTESVANRWTFSCVECSLLDRQYAGCCF